MKKFIKLNWFKYLLILFFSCFITFLMFYIKFLREEITYFGFPIPFCNIDYSSTNFYCPPDVWCSTPGPLLLKCSIYLILANIVFWFLIILLARFIYIKYFKKNKVVEKK